MKRLKNGLVLLDARLMLRGVYVNHDRFPFELAQNGIKFKNLNLIS